MRWQWFAALVPLSLGLIIAVLIGRGWLANRIISVSVDLGELVIYTGFITTALIITYLTLREREKRIRQQSVSQTQAQAVADRRLFIAKLHHMFKSPLQRIRMQLERLAAGFIEDTQRNSLESIKDETLLIARLMEDLDKLASLETKALEKEPVDVGALLTSVVEAARVRPEAISRHLTLNLPQAPRALPSIVGEHDMLTVAIEYLLDNALKYTRSGDTIEVWALQDGAHVIIKVSDTGPGIPDSEAADVWKELVRGKDAQDRKIPGNGLGLPFVRAMVLRHGGQVTLDSRDGGGTAITIHLPVGQPVRTVTSS